MIRSRDCEIFEERLDQILTWAEVELELRVFEIVGILMCKAYGYLTQLDGEEEEDGTDGGTTGREGRN